jgi:hypothetical protein
MNIFFHGSPLDVYIHWMIFSLGLGILVSGIAIFTSCRSFARILNLKVSKNTLGTRIYRAYSSYHSSYWYVFGIILVMHLFTTGLHLGLPVIGEPYFIAQQVTLFTSIGNLVFLLIILTSCRTFAFFISNNPLTNNTYKRFYKYHSYFWVFLAMSVGGHIVFGMIHSMNT